MAEMLKSVAIMLLFCSILPCAWGVACWDSCGNLQVKYPFRTGPGCGDPRFQSLNCNASSSFYNCQNFLCDTGSAHICTSLYTCPGVQGLKLPQLSTITSCCVYTPLNLGSANEVNLAKLGCESYTSIYNFTTKNNILSLSSGSRLDSKCSNIIDDWDYKSLPKLCPIRNSSSPNVYLANKSFLNFEAVEARLQLLQCKCFQQGQMCNTHMDPCHITEKRTSTIHRRLLALDMF